MVAYSMVKSLLKTCTMLRSPALSISLNAYVPAGRILLPGSSTGWLNVKYVNLLDSSALAGDPNAATKVAIHRANATRCRAFIVTPPRCTFRRTATDNGHAWFQ